MHGTLDTSRATINAPKRTVKVLISYSGADASDSGVKYSSKIIVVNDINIVSEDGCVFLSDPRNRKRRALSGDRILIL